MRVKNVSVLKRFLSILLCVGLIFGLLPAIARAEETEAASEEASTTESQYSEDDYTYVYLVKTKKNNLVYDLNGKKYKPYDKYTYKYDENGLIVKSDRDSNNPAGTQGQLGETIYEYDENKNLIHVDGPYFDFTYYYKNNRLVKFDMFSLRVVAGYSAKHHKHKLKYRKKDRSVYIPYCAGGLPLPKGDRYSFSKGGKPQKSWFSKDPQNGSWSGKGSYSYDKKGNLAKFKSENISSKSISTTKYSLTYKKGRLTKRKNSQPDNQVTSTTYKYRKVKILKKYKKQVEEQQWRILNFDDLHDLGINQPWKY